MQLDNATAYTEALLLYPLGRAGEGEIWILDMMMITMMMNDDNDDDGWR